MDYMLGVPGGGVPGCKPQLMPSVSVLLVIRVELY